VSEFLKCLKPDCMRKVTRGAAYCCEPCNIADTPPDRYELDPHDPAAHWTFVHSEFCERRKEKRGECSPLEADMLDQSRDPNLITPAGAAEILRTTPQAFADWHKKGERR